MVLNTQCYPYLWLTMNAKNQKKHSKIKIVGLYVNFAPNLRNHKKYSKKTLLSIAICSKYFISMVYFRCYLMNPHVQAVQKCVAKGGRGCFRPSYGWPKLTLFSKKNPTKMNRQKNDTATIFKLSLPK